jgi:hypothetical protein
MGLQQCLARTAHSFESRFESSPHTLHRLRVNVSIHRGDEILVMNKDIMGIHATTYSTNV